MSTSSNTGRNTDRSTGSLSTKDLMGCRVLGGRKGTSHIGKVHAILFHPHERRVVGISVKRPDLALMFHRDDLYIPLAGFSLHDGAVVLQDTKPTNASNALDVAWDACIIWTGLPLIDKDGTEYGTVASVRFDADTGKVQFVEASDGATSQTLLGTRHIPAQLVYGFRTGTGARLAGTDEELRGALLVSCEVADIEVSGGFAEKAGTATAQAIDSAKRNVQPKLEKAAHTVHEKAESQIKPQINKASDKLQTEVKPKLNKAASSADEAINKGAFALGKQLGKSKGMFADFKREYDKAKRDGS